jgi:organic radical activating enzyme
MSSLLTRLLPFGKKPEPTPPGVYHLQAPPDAVLPYRLHLRVEADGSGVLIVNAATVLHLNTSAAAHALELVRGASEEAAAAEVSRRFRVSRSRALADHRAIRDEIIALATTPHVDPVVYLGLDRDEPYSAALSAPYRLDLALTYTTDPDGAMDPLARRRVDRELTTEEWKQVMSKAWEAGIPHVTFTGGEPTRRPDLAELIAHGQALGQVTGVLTEGRRFADTAYLDSLSKAGLDHILVSLVPDDPASRAGLKAAVACEVFAAVHLTLTPKLAPRAEAMLADLKAMGVPAISLSASDRSEGLARALASARETAARLGLDLIWDLPTPYSSHNPISLELEAPSQGAGKAWLYVEPDGDVLPTQGQDKVLGNILRDPWASIWGKARE